MRMKTTLLKLILIPAALIVPLTMLVGCDYRFDDSGATFRFFNRGNTAITVEYFSLNERQVDANRYFDDTSITRDRFLELVKRNNGKLSVYVSRLSATDNDRKPLCRYDLTADDWDICRKLQFPPSPEMKHIGMEPSYEELTRWAPSIHELVTNPENESQDL